jgi:DNA topoisomerase-1
VEREHSIQQFKPDEFWEISFNAENDKNISIAFNLNRKKSDPLLQAEEAKKIEELVKSSNILVSEVTQKPVKSKPKPPFITSTLQQAASTKLVFDRLFTLNPSFVLAACCNVDVINGGFGFDLTGF